MKEIIYIQAGKFSNYVGTHFWNTQEAYFTYGEGEDPIVFHDISFREGQTLNGEPTFCPRLLLFDRKANCGTLNANIYGGAAVKDEEDSAATWNGDVVEYKQDRIQRSKFQQVLEHELETNEDEDNLVSDPPDAKDVRFWSDYNRVSYHPRSIQKIPDVAEYEDVDGDWNASSGLFTKLDEEALIMEDSFRFFVEECDNLQGLQLMNDTSDFGGFTHSFLTAIRDEFVKLPCLSFSFLSDSTFNLEDSKSIRKALNDALFLRSMNELASITVPLQSPSLWKSSTWSDELIFDASSAYHTSAILSSHIENSTLPLRLKAHEGDMYSLISSLNWTMNTKLAHLSGVFPLTSCKHLDPGMRRIYDFTTGETVQYHPNTTFSQVNVTRGLSISDLTDYHAWYDVRQPPPKSIHAPAIPIPNSYPDIFFEQSKSISALSTLSTTSATSSLLAKYASLVDSCLKRNVDVLARMGLELDDVKELRDELWALEDEYKGDDDGVLDEGNDSLGEDE